MRNLRFSNLFSYIYCAHDGPSFARWPIILLLENKGKRLYESLEGKKPEEDLFVDALFATCEQLENRIK